MSVTPLPDLILYGRPGCQLCDEARAMTVSLLDDRASRGLPRPTLVDRDIEINPDWQRAYFLTIPVLELGDRKLELVTSLAKVRRLLTEVLDGVPSPEPSPAPSTR